MDLPNGNFLLPDATALVEGAVFLVVLVVVSKFVLPRLHGLAAQRKQLIDNDLSSASDAESAARHHEEEAALLIGQAHREARAIIDRAYERHDFIVAEGMRKGREEYEWFTRKLDTPRRRPGQAGDVGEPSSSRAPDEQSDVSASLNVG